MSQFKRIYTIDLVMDEFEEFFSTPDREEAHFWVEGEGVQVEVHLPIALMREVLKKYDNREPSDDPDYEGIAAAKHRDEEARKLK